MIQYAIVSDSEKRLSMKTGSIFLLISFLIRPYTGFLALSQYLAMGARPSGLILLQLIGIPILELIIAIGLWKGDRSINRLLILLVLYYVGNVATRLANGKITAELTPHLLDGISLISLSLALGILLVGKAQWIRRWISVGIFIIGYLGTFLLVHVLFVWN